MRSLVVAGLIFAVTPFSIFAQSKIRLPKIEPFGYDGFRLMLQQQGLTNVQLQLASAMQTPEETVVVFLGDLSQAFRIRHELTEFVDHGGALLVATDLGGNRKPIRLPWMYSSTFLAERMRFRPGDLFLAGYEDCPRVTRIAPAAASGLFEGVESLAANRPGYLRASSEVQAVAWLPRAVGSDRAEALIATARKGTGRLLLIADHSLLINEMLVHADNARFASNVASWLTENGPTKTVGFLPG